MSDILERFTLGWHTLEPLDSKPPQPPLRKGGTRNGPFRLNVPPLRRGGWGVFASAKECARVNR